MFFYRVLKISQDVSHGARGITNRNMRDPNACQGLHDRHSDDRERNQNAPANGLQLHLVLAANDIPNTDLYSVPLDSEVKMLHVWWWRPLSC